MQIAFKISIPPRLLMLITVVAATGLFLVKFQTGVPEKCGSEMGPHFRFR